MCGPNASVGRGRSEGISAVEEGQRAGRSEVKKSTAASSSGAGTRSGGGGVEGVTSAGGKIAEYYTGMKKVTLSMSPTRVKVRASADHRVLYPDHVF